VQEVKDKVEVILSDLPDGIEKPAISKIDIASAMPVMQIVLEPAPNIGAQAGYTRNLSDMMTSTPIASNPVSGALIYQDIDTNRDNEFTIGLGVNQTLFDAASR
jgi:hypothetical protein